MNALATAATLDQISQAITDLQGISLAGIPANIQTLLNTQAGLDITGQTLTNIQAAIPAVNALSTATTLDQISQAITDLQGISLAGIPANIQTLLNTQAGLDITGQTLTNIQAAIPAVNALSTATTLDQISQAITDLQGISLAGIPANIQTLLNTQAGLDITGQTLTNIQAAIPAVNALANATTLDQISQAITDLQGISLAGIPANIQTLLNTQAGLDITGQTLTNIQAAIPAVNALANATTLDQISQAITNLQGISLAGIPANIQTLLNTEAGLDITGQTLTNIQAAIPAVNALATATTLDQISQAITNLQGISLAGIPANIQTLLNTQAGLDITGQTLTNIQAAIPAVNALANATTLDQISQAITDLQGISLAGIPANIQTLLNTQAGLDITGQTLTNIQAAIPAVNALANATTLDQISQAITDLQGISLAGIPANIQTLLNTQAGLDITGQTLTNIQAAIPAVNALATATTLDQISQAITDLQGISLAGIPSNIQTLLNTQAGLDIAGQTLSNIQAAIPAVNALATATTLDQISQAITDLQGISLAGIPANIQTLLNTQAGLDITGQTLSNIQAAIPAVNALANATTLDQISQAITDLQGISLAGIRQTSRHY